MSVKGPLAVCSVGAGLSLPPKKGRGQGHISCSLQGNFTKQSIPHLACGPASPTVAAHRDGAEKSILEGTCAEYIIKSQNSGASWRLQYPDLGGRGLLKAASLYSVVIETLSVGAALSFFYRNTCIHEQTRSSKICSSQTSGGICLHFLLVYYICAKNCTW